MTPGRALLGLTCWGAFETTLCKARGTGLGDPILSSGKIPLAFCKSHD